MFRNNKDRDEYIHNYRVNRLKSINWDELPEEEINKVYFSLVHLFDKE